MCTSLHKCMALNLWREIYCISEGCTVAIAAVSDLQRSVLLLYNMLCSDAAKPLYKLFFSPALGYNCK